MSYELRPPSEAATEAFGSVSSDLRVVTRAEHLQSAWDAAFEGDADFANHVIDHTNPTDNIESGLINLKKLPEGGFLYVKAIWAEVNEDEGFRNLSFLYTFYNGAPMTERQFDRLLDSGKAGGMVEIGEAVDGRLVIGEYEEAGRIDPFSVVEGLMLARSHKALRAKSAESRDFAQTIRGLERDIVGSLKNNSLNRIKGNEKLQRVVGSLAILLEDMPQEVPDAIDTLK